MKLEDALVAAEALARQGIAFEPVHATEGSLRFRVSRWWEVSREPFGFRLDPLSLSVRGMLEVMDRGTMEYGARVTLELVRDNPRGVARLLVDEANTKINELLTEWCFVDELGQHGDTRPQT